MRRFAIVTLSVGCSAPSARAPDVVAPSPSASMSASAPLPPAPPPELVGQFSSIFDLLSDDARLLRVALDGATPAFTACLRSDPPAEPYRQGSALVRVGAQDGEVVQADSDHQGLRPAAERCIQRALLGRPVAVPVGRAFSTKVQVLWCLPNPPGSARCDGQQPE